MNFTFVELTQNTPDWHAWRAGGVGASEAPAILGVSPYATADDILRSKLGGEAQASNPAMQRGHDLEPQARAAFEAATGRLVSPCCVQSIDEPFLRASLDGLDLDGIPLEAKAPGMETHGQMIDGIVPEYWLVQVQYQLAIVGALFAFLVSYHPDHEQPLAIVRIEADQALQARILAAVRAFWARVESARSGTPTFAPDVQARAITVNAETVGQQAAELIVHDDETYRAGGEFLVAIATKRKEIERLKDHLLEPIKEARRRLDDFITAPLSALSGAEQGLRRQMTDYRTAQERKAAEARAAAIAEAEAKARAEREAAERAAAEARAAMATADDESTRTAAAAVLARAEDAQRSAAVIRPMVAPVQAPPKAAGISSRTNWSAECIDLRALLTAAIDKPELLAFVQVNAQALNAHARAVKGAFSVPGCRVISEATTAVRTAK